jgi:formate/nitrite transporter FocA (FNT family)
MSLFFGIMIFLALHTAKRSSKQFFKSLIVVMCIMIFVLSGFDHSIANTFYYSLANVWSLNTIFYLLVIIGGNSLGGIFLPSLFSIIDKLSK